jgi:hypothetical protein
MKWFVLLALAATTLASSHEAQNKHACESKSAFTECARAGTQKYQDQRIAIADGYQRIGRDFPAMGEHWINTTLLFDGKLDAAHPEVLTYITVGGRARLLGVAYAVPLLPGESTPPWPSAEADWHDHFRTLDDETLVRQHDATHNHHASLPRISMLHAWIWLDNPDGVFATENWSIPYLRLSLVPPNPATPEASKAISMPVGGTDFFLMSIEAAAQLSRSDRKTILSAFQGTEGKVHAFLSSRAATAALTQEDLSYLSGLWTNMWTTINASVRRQTRLQLRDFVGKF